MSNQEILIKAIEKAIGNGWNDHPNATDDDGYAAESVLESYTDPHYPAVRELIFSHDFAKALWGENRMQGLHEHMGWQHHLQQMVVAEDPIKYLGAHLA